MSAATNFTVAYAHLTSRKRQAAIAILSVTFGVGLFIFMKGFVGGVNSQQADLVFASTAHIHIFNEVNTQIAPLVQTDTHQVVHLRNPKAIQYTEGIKNADQIISDISANPAFVGLTTQINLNGTFSNGSIRVSGLISGVEVEQEDALFGMQTYTTEGDWNKLDNSNNYVVVGRGVARKLNVTIGNTITLTTIDNVSKQFVLVGVVFTGMAATDDRKVYIRKNAALQLAGKNRSYASDIQIMLHDYEQAEKVAEPLKSQVNYKVESWQESNQQLVTANTLRKMISTVVPLVLIIVAGFGIYNIMSMTVNEKIKDIAILKALGFSGKDIVEIFVTQAAIIGVVGGIGGNLLGFTISTIMSKLPISMGVSDHLKILFEPQTYLLATMIGLVVTLLAGFFPARKAASVDPVQIIRG